MPSQECKGATITKDNKVDTVTTIRAEVETHKEEWVVDMTIKHSRTRAKALGMVVVTKWIKDMEISNSLEEISVKITNSKDTWLKDLKTSNNKNSAVGWTRITTSNLHQAERTKVTNSKDSWLKDLKASNNKNNNKEAA